MRKLLFIAIATCFLTQANAAPASRESVEALLEATKSQTTMESAYPAMEQFIRQSMQQAAGATPLTPEQMRIFDAMPARVMVVMRSEFSWEKMKPEFIQLYQGTFDQEEIDGLLVFYRSTAGQAFVNKMPTVMQKTMILTQAQMQRLMPKIKATIEQAAKEARLEK